MENKYRKNFPFFKAIDENEAGEKATYWVLQIR